MRLSFYYNCVDQLKVLIKVYTKKAPSYQFTSIPLAMIHIKQKGLQALQYHSCETEPKFNKLSKLIQNIT